MANEKAIAELFSELLWEYELTSRFLIRERSKKPWAEEARLLTSLAEYKRRLNEILDEREDG